MTQNSTGRMRRPRSVTFLSEVVLIFAVAHLMRCGLAFSDWHFLSLILPFSPAYLAITGFAWGIAGLGVGAVLWFGNKYARTFTLGFVLLYSVYYWLDRTLISEYEQVQANWLFAIGINIIILLVSTLLLNQTKVRLFFKDSNEQRREIRTAS